MVKLFSEVENKNVPIPEFPEHPFQEEHLRVGIEMYLLSGMYTLSDSFYITAIHCALHYFCVSVLMNDVVCTAYDKVCMFRCSFKQL